MTKPNTTDAEIDEIIWGGMNKERQVIALKALLLRERHIEEAVIRKDAQLKTVLEIVELLPINSPERKKIADWWAETFPKEAAELSRLSGEGKDYE